MGGDGHKEAIWSRPMPSFATCGNAPKRREFSFLKAAPITSPGRAPRQQPLRRDDFGLHPIWLTGVIKCDDSDRMTETTIPLLPCRTSLIEAAVGFYAALGFETTFLQKSPYAYAVVERGSVELQLYGMKDYDPASSHSGCYVLTDGVDGLHAAFRAGLKAATGASRGGGCRASVR